MFIHRFEIKLNYVLNEINFLCLFNFSSLRYVSFSLSGLGFDAWVHRNDNKLAIINMLTG